MWVVSDNDMRELLGGEFSSLVIARALKPDIKVFELFRHQDVYKTSSGFAKFYRSTLSKIISTVRFVDDGCVTARAIKAMVGLRDE